jgi:hypothetical protein
MVCIADKEIRNKYYKIKKKHKFTFELFDVFCEYSNLQGPKLW